MPLLFLKKSLKTALCQIVYPASKPSDKKTMLCDVVKQGNIKLNNDFTMEFDKNFSPIQRRKELHIQYWGQAVISMVVMKWEGE